MRALHRCVVLLFVLLCLPGVAKAWVKGVQPPRTELTVVTEVFCRTLDNAARCVVPPGNGRVGRPESGPYSAGAWSHSITRAVEHWNRAGLPFVIRTRDKRSGETACTVTDAVVVIMVDETPPIPCLGNDIPNPFGAGSRYYAHPQPGRIYIGTDHRGGLVHLRRLLIHEMGHALGLDHPDDHGQQVRAIMNHDLGCNLGAEAFRFCDTVQPDDLMGVLAVNQHSVPEPEPRIVGTLENPAPDSYQSGIGVISGWLCEPGQVEITITDPRDGWTTTQKAAHGTSRGDTQGVCGDTDNGFGLTFNWNLLGDGEYEVVATVDGVEFGRAVATVTTLGVETLRGADGQGYVLYGFSRHGLTVEIEWSEALQNFVIVDVAP